MFHHSMRTLIFLNVPLIIIKVSEKFPMHRSYEQEKEQMSCILKCVNKGLEKNPFSSEHSRKVYERCQDFL